MSADPGVSARDALELQPMNAIAHLFRRSSRTVALWSQEARATVMLAVPLVLTVMAYRAVVTTDRVMMG
jgi:Na+-driven multidrug efflux pump